MSDLMKLRQFTIDDNHEFKSWFEDMDINRWIGPAWDAQELQRLGLPNEEILCLEDKSHLLVLPVWILNNLISVR